MSRPMPRASPSRSYSSPSRGATYMAPTRVYSRPIIMSPFGYSPFGYGGGGFGGFGKNMLFCYSLFTKTISFFKQAYVSFKSFIVSLSRRIGLRIGRNGW
uniref:Uncharacterized protein n=1 Tax=Proboscia inermis TaxID=420281 RepID=A0A7S0CCW7_9STRA|mmetsp:Transcript_37652/g.38007  ORF Transcript_37652/g.38007 Transcript_37652/m.38007 type:complete len:100 (+) Transcript_37652:1-300(+)